MLLEAMLLLYDTVRYDSCKLIMMPSTACLGAVFRRNHVAMRGYSRVHRSIEVAAIWFVVIYMLEKDDH